MFFCGSFWSVGLAGGSKQPYRAIQSCEVKYGDPVYLNCAVMSVCSYVDSRCTWLKRMILMIIILSSNRICEGEAYKI